MSCNDYGYIEIIGAKENNLKNLNIKIPKNKIVAIVGKSGSGKSSLVYDTIASEAKRQLYNMFPLYLRNKMNYQPVPNVDGIKNLTATVVINQRAFSTSERSNVGTIIDIMPLIRLLFSRFAQPSLGTSEKYSFNHPDGMCPICKGAGKIVEFDMDKVLDKTKSLNEDPLRLPGFHKGSYYWQLYANSGFFDNDKPIEKYTDDELNNLYFGKDKVVSINNNTGTVWDKSYNTKYEGLLDKINRLYLNKNVEKMNKNNLRIIENFTVEKTCNECMGRRLNSKVLDSRFEGYNIWEICEFEVHDLLEFLNGCCNDMNHTVIDGIINTLSNLENIGLGYLKLNQDSKSLSGGEIQRLKIVRNLNSNLTGLTYIFDEPSAGLHPKDVVRLNRLLIDLREKGNSVMIVDHNPEILSVADEIIELGPGAGENGGRLVFQGSPEELYHADTITSRSLKQCTSVKKVLRKPSGFIRLDSCSNNNLKKISVDFPEKIMTVVTGVAGSGKSSLVYEALSSRGNDVIYISQAPIGTTSRSNTATYVGIMDEIRRCFGKANNVSSSLFSCNSKGACPVCEGKGYVQTEMAFAEPVTIMCEACEGKKFNRTALTYTLRDRNIFDVLNMTVTEALEYFEEPKIIRKLQMLMDVGLDYIRLGQTTSTMSGGECQRLKLASHLNSTRGLYVLDEPATGLHSADVELLLELLNRITDNGNTVIVVEHNMRLISQADWVIELGPGGGKNGGEIIFQGTPAELLEFRGSNTSEYLRKSIKNPD